jgi:tetratricopeptide (TPR) repeat protein
VLARLLASLGGDLCNAGRYDEASDALFEALEIRERILPASSSMRADTLARIGTLMSRQERFDEAESYLQDALTILEDHPSDPATLASILARLGEHYERSGEHEQALEILSRALDLHLELFGRSHWGIAYVQERMAGVHRREGRFDEAERLLLDALKIHDSGVSSPAEARDGATAYGLLLLRDMDRPGEAEPYLRRAYELGLSDQESSEATLNRVTHNLADCLRALNREDEALRILK